MRINGAALMASSCNCQMSFVSHRPLSGVDEIVVERVERVLAEKRNMMAPAISVRPSAMNGDRIA